MEIYQLKYFCAAAELENFGQAAKQTHTTPPSITKAVAALEQELGVNLFAREGRNVRLTKQGAVYYQRVQSMLADLKNAHLDLVGELPGHRLTLTFAGREVLLRDYVLPLLEPFGHKTIPWNIQLIEESGSEAEDMVNSGKADVAIVARKPHKNGSCKLLDKMVSRVFCHPEHRLAKSRKKRAVAMEELLHFPFVAPTSPIFGKVSVTQSPDGWRDDTFPRQVPIATENLGLILDAVNTHHYLAFLPESFGKRHKLSVIDITGGLVACRWEVYLYWRHTALQPILQRLFRIFDL